MHGEALLHVGGRLFHAAALEVTQLPHTCSVSKPRTLINLSGRPLVELNFASH